MRRITTLVDPRTHKRLHAAAKKANWRVMPFVAELLDLALNAIDDGYIKFTPPTSGESAELAEKASGDR